MYFVFFESVQLSVLEGQPGRTAPSCLRGAISKMHLTRRSEHGGARAGRVQASTTAAMPLRQGSVLRADSPRLPHPANFQEVAVPPLLGVVVFC